MMMHKIEKVLRTLRKLFQGTQSRSGRHMLFSIELYQFHHKQRSMHAMMSLVLVLFILCQHGMTTEQQSTNHPKNPNYTGQPAQAHFRQGEEGAE